MYIEPEVIDANLFSFSFLPQVRTNYHNSETNQRENTAWLQIWFSLEKLIQNAVELVGAFADAVFLHFHEVVVFLC